MEDLSLGNGFEKYRYYILAILIGLILVAGGVLFFKKSVNFSATKVEILQSSSDKNAANEITVEISGSVIKPGVYKFSEGSRVDDLLIIAGGFSENADRGWTDKYLNRAAKLDDGQKIFIPSIDERSDKSSAKNGGLYQSESSTFSSYSNQLVNINTASLSELDTIPGIGQVYGQKIIEHRPYSKTEDLVESGAITQTLYEKIKNAITVY
jgi:competence protein ComEA